MEDEEQVTYDPTKLPAVQPDKYTRCPYFPEHELRVSRLPYHLIKCQNNPDAPRLLACPYNYLHRVKPEEQREHMLTCEDKVMVKYADRNPPSIGSTRRQILMRGGNLDESNKSNTTQSNPSSSDAGSVEEEEEQW